MVEDGRSLSIERGRQRALLAYLLLRANEVVGQDMLVDALWGESPPATAVTALHGYVSRLRRVLGDGRLQTRPPGYVLRVAPDELDLNRFRDLLAQDRHREALALWRGPALADLAFEDFTQSEIARLEELRLTALEGRFEHELAEGRHAELAGELAAAVRSHPLRERLAGQLMLALYRAGRQADALEVYRDTRTTLVEQLGLEPGDALRALQRRILIHDPTLDHRWSSRRTVLPASLTSFVGRRRELEELRALVVRPGVRLLTLTGAGGTGKTRLAIEVARAAAGQFADGARFAPLAAVAEPELLADGIAQALALQPSRGQSIKDALRAFLVDRELLLVLDNLEHLLEATPVATELLAAAPGLTILATSRTHLDLYGETEYAVPPLSAREDAVQLFADRAAAARPDFAVTEVVAEICARLDGLPLAIELAAARIRTLAPTDILARLERRLELLTGGPRDVPARQRTLRDTLLWSYDLLEPVEQRLFARLAVFSGGWPVAAADTVCCRDLALDASAGLQSLAEKNLVLPDADARFGMLETIRELAGEQLVAGGEDPAIRAAHARWCLAMAEEGGPNRRGAERAAWLERLDGERENLRAALAWAGAGGDVETGLRLAAALAPFWMAHGLIEEGKRSLTALLAGPREPSLGRTRALSAAGLFIVIEGDLERGERVCRESLMLSRPGEEWYRSVALNVLGTATRYRGRWEEARNHYGEALTLATAGDLWWPAALVQANLGALAELEGRDIEAMEHFEQAVDIARPGGDEWMLALCLMNSARAIRRLGELDRASGLQAEALRLFVAVDNAWGIAASLAGFAALAAARGDHARAARLYGAEEAIRERARVGVWLTIAPEHQAGQQATASALGEATWTQARAQGRALTQTEAIAEATLHSQPATG
ncbi:MAG TPA: BTAD domain-containing putative transcriptional regulator [Solirubrobacter sp.]|nr:BTAD domain-containing putative transcriptional regulator [Solirubrobacter sp.]